MLLSHNFGNIGVVIVLDLSHSNRCVEVSYCYFIIFQWHDIEHFICLFARCLSSWMISVQNLVKFLMRFFFFLMLNFKHYFLFWKWVFYQIYMIKTFQIKTVYRMNIDILPRLCLLSSFSYYCLSSVQFSSVTQSCITLCDPMDCSRPGLPVYHQLLEFIQTHVHWVGNVIQPSHPLLSPSPPTFNLSQNCLS